MKENQNSDYLSYEGFKDTVLQKLGQDIEEPKKISLQSVRKNNGVILDGLVIMEQNRNISPTIYLNQFYDEYASGLTFDSAYQKILSTYQKNKPSMNIDVQFFTDFKYAKGSIVYKLINYEKNELLLQEIPHIRFLDLAIVFYCLINMDEQIGNATILIHNIHLQHWDITLDDILQIAHENTPCLLSYKFKNMQDVLQEFADGQNLGLLPANDNCFPMYVLSNQSNLFGAVCMLYDNLLKQCSEELKTDFYILPSSIHEIILVPAHNKDSFEELSEMVREINLTQLSAEEILSDHVYFYSRTEDSITSGLPTHATGSYPPTATI